MSERERFEAWALSENFNVDRCYDDAHGKYHRATTRWAWMAWQAARSGQAASGSSQGARSDVQNGVGVGQPEAPTAAPPDFSADAVRAKFEESFLDYFGRQPEGAAFDKLGGFWLARTEDGRYEIARVDDAWTGWLAAARYYAHIETLWRVAKLGHEQAFAECQRLAAHPPARSGAGSEDARDAARYRWLRENVNGLQWESVHDDCGRDLLDGAELDRAIDAASAKPDRSEES